MLLVAAHLFAQVAAAAVLRHALIIGANEGGGGLVPLRYAESDAQKMAEVLVELGGFDAAHVTVLYAPTSTEIRAALKAHADVAASFEEDMFLLYYSGHADARGLRIDQETYTFEALKAEFHAMPSEVRLGILDACRSGTITRLKGASLSAPFLEEDALAVEGEAWVTAASAEETAQESDQLRGSFFTHYFVSGLRGAADTGDGEVSLDEAYVYANDRVIDRTGGTAAGVQHPSFDYKLKGQGGLPLTRVAEGRATVTLPEELSGQVTVLRLPDRTPVAEVAKRTGVPVTLALAPGTYKFRLSQGKDIREAVVGVTDGSRVSVSRWGSVGVEVGSVKGTDLLALDAGDLVSLSARTGKSMFVEALNPSDLRHSPLLAGGASVVPGLGQFYNHQWGKGVLYMVGTSIALSSSLGGRNENADFFTGSITGPDMLATTAAMLWGASVADAAHHARVKETERPHDGVALSTAASWSMGGPRNTPAAAGMNAEFFLPPKHLTVELDRVGWTRGPDDGSVWGAGGRINFVLDTARLRPGVFVALGARLTTAPDMSVQSGDPTAPEEVMVGPEAAWVAGTGVSLRWYVTPRYFVQWEVRGETDGGPAEGMVGAGLGVHFKGG